MKSRLFSIVLMLVPLAAQAEDDPILFTVGDLPVARSEFEQSYLKNTTVSRAGQMTIADYLELYITYKLKVKAALDAHIDATSSFRQAYSQCLGSRSAESVVSSEGPAVPPVLEQMVNTDAGELIRLSQIMIRVPQKASRESLQEAQEGINSIYKELQGGADFEQTARVYSQDGKSPSVKSVVGWYAHGQMLQEIEDVAFRLREGEISRPFLSTLGYHILLVTERKEPGSEKTSLQLLSEEKEKRQIYRRTSLVPLSGELLSSVSATNDDFQIPTGGLQREYFEGLLLCELSKRSVGRHAAEDEDALKYYFKKNKKKYRRKGFKPKDYTEVRELVVADLQEEMDKHWLADLRKTYPVSVDKKVLKTVNNHL
ncbi:MAG: peptidyl-prolyl cis-trans isomerase [Prevotella sp.]|nr:peptidyl-prolyl cis-trans isomerase [Prevotella sp.]